MHYLNQQILPLCLICKCLFILRDLREYFELTKLFYTLEPQHPLYLIKQLLINAHGQTHTQTHLSTSMAIV